jgi:hypothetical protein
VVKGQERRFINIAWEHHGKKKVIISAHLHDIDMSFRFRGRIGAGGERCA